MTRPGRDRVVAVTAATLFGAGTAYLAAEVPQAEPAVAAAPAQYAGPLVPIPSGDPTPAPTPAQPTATAVAVPERVTLRRLDIDLPVEPHGVDQHGRMALPDDPAVAGWYRFGAAPSSRTGAVVIAAHVDSRAHGVGPLRRLSSAQAGDQVLLTTGTGEWHYSVVSVQRPAKREVDEAALFARDGAPRLHLVTCTGRYERGVGYDANLVVIAALVRHP